MMKHCQHADKQMCDMLDVFVWHHIYMYFIIFLIHRDQIVCASGLLSYRGNCSTQVNNRGDVIYMNCCNTNLSSVPDNLPATLEDLRLCDNTIHNTTYKFKELNALIRLDLSRNKIRRLDRDSFAGLLKLEVLIVSYNELVIGDIGVLPNDVFSGIPGVYTLDISANDIGNRYPEEALSQLLDLRELIIDGQEDVVFGKNFLKLTRLTSLHMSDWDGAHCSLFRLTRDTLRNLKYLTNLELINCNLVEIERMAFADLSKLEKLDLSWNDHIGFDVFENGSFSLPLTNIKELILSHITKPGEYGNHEVFGHHLKHLSNTSLEAISLDKNHLFYFTDAALLMLPITLKRFSLRNNELYGGEFIKYLTHFVNLEFIDVSYQRQPWGIEKANSVYRHDYFPLKRHIPKRTGWNILPLFQSSRPCVPVFLQKKLMTVLGSHMNLPGNPIPCFDVILHPNEVEFIDISGDDFCPWIGPVRGFDSLKVVNMSHNRCDDASGEFFIGFNTLQTLDLSGNSLQYSITNSPDIFAKMVNLKLIILSGNGLKILPIKLFTEISTMEEIVLTNNSLTTIDFLFHPRARIANINLADNQLGELPKKLREKLDGLAQSTTHGVNVSLNGNNLKCSCDSIEFASWLKTTKVHLVDHNSYKCTHANGTLIYVSGLNINQLRLYCVFADLVWGALVLLLLLVIFVAVPVAIHHNRWKIRYLYYSRGNDINPFELEESGAKSQEEPLIESGVNSYFSFDDQAAEFRILIQNSVMRVLASAGISSQTRETCIRPGRSKMICITRSINRTKKTVVFCSNEYFKDFHNLYEFNCSILKGIRTRRRTLVIVNLTGMAFNKTTVPDESILAYLKSHGNSVYQYRDGNAEKLIDYLKKQI